MMKTATAILILALAACLPQGKTVPVGEARDSVYKVDVTLTLDISQLLPPKTDSTAPKSKDRYKDIFVDLEGDFPDMEATVLSGDDSTVRIGWHGTGWVSGRTRSSSYIMTAGHVCESGSVYKARIIDWSTLTMKVVELPITKVEHTLIDHNDVEFSGAIIVSDEDLDEEYNGHDLCMLAIAGDLGTPLPLSDEDPAYGDSSEVIGAPKGIWGGGVAVIGGLRFSGRGNIFKSKTDGLIFTGDAAPGNSGSAIMHGGRVVALLNLGDRRFPQIHSGVPREVVVDFIRRALHREPRD